jgi:hypothetical protein
MNLTGKVISLNIFDTTQTLLLTKNVSSTSTAGLVSFSLNPVETFVIPDGNVYYRILIGDTDTTLKPFYRGFLTCEVPEYSSGNGSIQGNVTVLPDGTLYALSPVTIQPGVWYACNSFYHFLVTGVGSMTMDGKDLAGGIFGSVSTWINSSSDPTAWLPNLTGMQAFRINIVSGGNTVSVKYLP